MIAAGDRVLVAVSGGKDSLAVWDILLDARLRRRRALRRARHRRLQRRARATYARAFARDAGLHLIEVDLPDDYGYDIPTGARAAGGCRARRAGCRSATSSTRPRSTAATTSSSPATTSTTRRRCCSATCCAGRPSTSAASCRCCRPRRLPEEGQAARPPGRARDGGLLHHPRHRLHRRRVPDGGRQQAPRLQGGAERDRGQSPGTKYDFYFGFLRRAAERFRPEAEGEQADLRPCTALRRADHRRGVRVLPPGRAGRRPPPRRRARSSSARIATSGRRSRAPA